LTGRRIRQRPCRAGPGGSGTTPGNIDFVLAPQDFAIQYDLNPLYTASAPVTGSGQTIAIINDSNININLVNQFRSLFGLPVNPPQVIIDGNDPGLGNDDPVEAYLDVEWAGAVAPNATIDLVIAADTELEAGLQLAVELSQLRQRRYTVLRGAGAGRERVSFHTVQRCGRGHGLLLQLPEYAGNAVGLCSLLDDDDSAAGAGRLLEEGVSDGTGMERQPVWQRCFSDLRRQWELYGPPSDCKLNLCGECFGSAQMYPACLWSFRSWP
jgi:hypothetical protein